MILNGVQCRQIPNVEFRICNLKFFLIQVIGFCKNWGMTAHVNRMLHPMGCGPQLAVGITSPVRKMERNFLSQLFTSSGTKSGIFCVAAGTETEGSAIGKTLGKNDLAATGADTVQANSTWLVSGARVILNFLRKSMPGMGLPTVACKNLALNSLS